MRIEAEASLSALIESTEDLIWSVDLDYRLITFNRALQQNILNTYGVRIEVGMCFHEALPPDRAALWPVFYTHVLAEGPFRVEYSRLDGGIMELAFNPIAVDGIATGISIFGKEITERKRAESALKEAEANLSALIENTEDLIWSVDLDYRLVTLNQALRQNIEKNFGSIIATGMGPQDFLPPERANLWPSLYQRALKEGPFRSEYSLADGRILELAFNPIVVDGETKGISVFGKDITEQKAADESRRFLAEVVESCEEAIITNAPSGVILTWNHGAETIYGYSTAEMIGKPFSMIIAPELRTLADRQLGELLGGAPLLETQGVALRKDGSRVHVTVTTWPIRNSAGAVTAICTIVRDVSSRHEAEKNQALLALLVESSGDLIHAINLDGTIASWNAGAERLTGYTSDEVLGKKTAFLVPPRLEDQMRQNLKPIRDGYSIGPFDAVVRRKDGSEVDVSLILSPIKNSNGEVVGSAAIARDISERKQSELALQDAEKKYRDIFEGALEGLSQATPEGRFLTANPAVARMLGYDSADELISTATDLARDVWVYPDERQQYLRQLGEHGFVPGFECQLKRKDGRHIWVSLNDRCVCGADGRLLYLEGFMEDITERKQAEKLLRDSEERYRTVFETHFDAINITRLVDGTIVDCNHAFLDLTGYERDEVIGRTSLELRVWADPRDRQAMVELAQRDSTFRGLEIQFRKKNGEIRWGEMSASVMEIDGVPCILSITRDLSAAKTAEKTIRNLAFYDPLTGLPNRRMLMERLRHPLVASARSSRSQALLMVDLDHFKTLNDTLSHQTGDLLLQEVARRILACSHEADTVCRLGGDEFVVVLEDLSKVAEEAAAQAMAVGKKILAAIGQPYLLENHECHSTASIGIAIIGNRQESTVEILQRAEIALYKAKEAGRNTLRFFSPALQAAVNTRATLEEDLRQGIKTNQFLLYYQPQVERGRLTGAEALIRWKHPKRGIVSPAEFIPLAEESRLILPLGDWVLQAACAQIALWAGRKETAHLTVAVNISALQFRQPSFVEQVLAILSRSGANPESLRLELTESMLVENLEDIIAKMNELKLHGVRFSLDDFGTGYSSLTYLKRLPLDRLKIDRSFVRDMLVDATSGAIAQTILSLGRAMGISVIAEGVETEAQRGYLAGLGCYSFQGFLFSPPLPQKQFEAFLRGFAEYAGQC
jgi:diguanylate cyclase (GGDEF)-like protein/PAS domain S-box-containing protein